jgi:hypothetical protein
MHAALRELDGEVRRSGISHLLRSPLELCVSSGGGYVVRGADRALESLVNAGLLRTDGTGRQATFVLDSEAAVVVRRELMTLPASLVAAYRRAGARWEAYASTAAKNRSMAPLSEASTVASSKPNRAKPPVADTA